MNEPHYSYLDEAESPDDDKDRKAPYYVYLAKKARSISFYDTKTLGVDELSDGVDNTFLGAYLNKSPANEFEYMQLVAETYENGGLIDLPQTQGVIYYESCSKCLVSYEETEEGCNFCYGLRQHLEIANNKFVDNQVGISFYEAHDLPRASQIYINGGLVNEIRENTFREIVSSYFGKVWRDAPSYNITMPENYYQRQQAPLIRVTIPEGYGRFIDHTKLHDINDDEYVASYTDPGPNTEQVPEWPEWLCGESCYNFTSFSNTTF